MNLLKSSPFLEHVQTKHGVEVWYKVDGRLWHVLRPQTPYGWVHARVPILDPPRYDAFQHEYCVGMQECLNYTHIQKLLLIYQKIGLVASDSDREMFMKAAKSVVGAIRRKRREKLLSPS